MKLLKLVTLGAIAASMASIASAQDIVYVAGSTAFRTGATAAIIDYLGSGGTAVYDGYYYLTAPSSTPSNPLGSDAGLYANGTIGTGGTATTIVETYWTGSLAGLVDLVAGAGSHTGTPANGTSAYINSTDTTVVSDINGSTVNAGSTGAYAGGYYFNGGTGIPATSPQNPDFIFSDSNKITIGKELSGATLSAPIGSYSSGTALQTAVTGRSVVDSGSPGATGANGIGFVGVVPFEWVIGNTGVTNTSITTMSQQVAHGLINNGYIPQSFLTGTTTVTGDLTNYFYLVGRNEDSGTRIGSFLEAQLTFTDAVNQYQIPGVAGDSSDNGTIQLYPGTTLNTEPNISFGSAGHSGYATGGQVAGALNTAESGFTAANFSNGHAAENTGSSFFLGYLGISDGAKVTNGKIIQYNGTSYSVNAVEAGKYTLWTYEHCYRLSTESGTAPTVANSVADNISMGDADINGSGVHDNPTTKGGDSTTAAGIVDRGTNTRTTFTVKRASLIEGSVITPY